MKTKSKQSAIPAILTIDCSQSPGTFASWARTQKAELGREYPCPICRGTTDVHFSITEDAHGRRYRALVCAGKAHLSSKGVIVLREIPLVGPGVSM